jgi:DNA-binding response OmpR family regulator
MTMSQEQDQPVASDLATVKTILIVEDDAHIGEFLERALAEETPYKPLVVSDGFAALKVTREVKPNLFVLDYHLPGMDGIEVYDQLHAVKAFRDTRAVIMSACLPKRELEKRSLVGLRKPLELSELLQMVQALLESEDGQ